MNYIEWAVYALSLTACVGIIAHGFDHIESHGVQWTKTKRTDSVVIVVFCGFAVFPVINTALSVGFLLWLFFEKD